MLGISHLVSGGAKEGDEVTGLCGFTYTCSGIKSLPVCGECVDITLSDLRAAGNIIVDLHHRLAEIADAFTMVDEFGQTSWFHNVTEDALAQAFWRPGPARFEGPELEDGCFYVIHP